MKPKQPTGRLLDTVARGRHTPSPMPGRSMPARVTCATFALLAALSGPAAGQQSALGYAIDLNHRADDSFKVTAWVGGLSEANAVYQFAATAPGTYQVMDIGRYVRSFEAFDAAGQPVPVERASVNQWKLSDPARVRT